MLRPLLKRRARLGFKRVLLVDPYDAGETAADMVKALLAGKLPLRYGRTAGCIS